MIRYWSMPRIWDRRRVFIVGGGPSLKGFDGARLRGRHCIGVNNSGLDIVPWCDVLFFADRRWLAWNVSRLSGHTGRYKVTRQWPAGVDYSPHEIHTVLHNRRDVLAKLPWEVAGACGGSGAINLAVHGGASEIILLGFDMHDTGPDNYHSDHREAGEPGMRSRHFIPALNRMAFEINARGTRVINCTPGSALVCFETGQLSDFV